MHRLIKVGGISVIAAVCGIFVFIFVQIIPLFQGATVSPTATVQLAPGDYRDVGVDRWSELPFVIDQNLDLHFINLAKDNDVTRITPELPDGKATSMRYNQRNQMLVYGFDDGRFCVVRLNYHETFDGNERTIGHDLVTEPAYHIGHQDHPIVDIDYAEADGRRVAAAIQSVGDSREVHLVTLKQKRSLLGAGKVMVDKRFDLSSQVIGVPAIVRAGTQADLLMVATEEGRVFYFSMQESEITLMQDFTPFGDLADTTVASMDFLFGGVSVVLSSPAGENRLYSLFVPEFGSSRLFGHTKTFPLLSGGAEVYAASQRNKSFLVGHGSELSLRYATTETVRWHKDMPFEVEHAVLSSKHDRMLLVDGADMLRIYDLDDPHPEAGVKAYFGKLWYEGSSAPKYDWQSTGASDDYEPKLSMVPLIVGTLKGTLYAMLFAVPVALLAALYTSQFLSWRMRVIVKPTMEIMASLPSVVLGFLAALWLAPIVETQMVFIILIFVVLPVIAMVFGQCWASLPMPIRKYVRSGFEFLVIGVVAAASTVVCWYLAPHVEARFCTVVDPVTNLAVSDFRLWWRQTTNTPFEQRNALVVGFVMGFAVIPIIFSIAEESLANVPPSLTSGALALGASRWQTAMRVVIPTGSAGIFSAVMIGLGRAVGETMIVLMATGNTPVMDLNAFTGMRTLSANIAVELPEAPHEGTLYRTLFLGALLLFMFTFFLNTIAEVMRQHLREKYKTV